MVLFDHYEGVRFPEENRILITHNGYIYYIYDYKYKRWRKYKNAGNDHITVENYQELTKDEIVDAMGGLFPKKETDFMRLCHPSELHIGNMTMLLKEDYAKYMSDGRISYAAGRFLIESHIRYKAYQGIRHIFDEAVEHEWDNDMITDQIVKLSYEAVGKDIFKREIEIIDGHDCSSYFWIQPVRVLDYTDTYEIDNVAEMSSAEISIEEEDVEQYLWPFLSRYYDEELEANRKRIDERWEDEDGNEHIEYKEGFEWNLAHNFYTFEAVTQMLGDIKATVNALSVGDETEYTRELRKKRGSGIRELLARGDLSQERINEFHANRAEFDDTPAELLIDFYKRFIYRLEYMMRVGKENGFDLISFMGP